jgi:hypothetical protein
LSLLKTVIAHGFQRLCALEPWAAYFAVAAMGWVVSVMTAVVGGEIDTHNAGGVDGFEENYAAALLRPLEVGVYIAQSCSHLTPTACPLLTEKQSQPTISRRSTMNYVIF